MVSFALIYEGQLAPRSIQILNTGRFVDGILHMFRVTGFDLSNGIKEELVHLPSGICGWGNGAGLRSENVSLPARDIIIITMCSDTPSGTYVFDIELPDGRRAEASLVHLVETATVETETMETEAVETEAVETEAVETEAVETETTTKSCSPWPEYMADMRVRLRVPLGLCLIRVSDPADFPSPRCIPPSGQPTGCYDDTTKTVWFQPGTQVGGERAALPHEYCHAHQDWQVTNVGLGGGIRNWPNTPQDVAFAEAYERYKAELDASGQSGFWTDFGLVEDFAQVCVGWMLPGPGTNDPYLSPALLEFVQKWLP